MLHHCDRHHTVEAGVDERQGQGVGQEGRVAVEVDPDVVDRARFEKPRHGSDPAADIEDPVPRHNLETRQERRTQPVPVGHAGAPDLTRTDDQTRARFERRHQPIGEVGGRRRHPHAGHPFDGAARPEVESTRSGGEHGLTAGAGQILAEPGIEHLPAIRTGEEVQRRRRRLRGDVRVGGDGIRGQGLDSASSRHVPVRRL